MRVRILSSPAWRGGYHLNTIGSIALITGIAGLAGYMALTAFTSWRPPRSISTAAIAGLLLLTCVGLILVTIASGGRSLHTGG
ncbi:hypothetical protein BMS3Abin01_00452 [bacterium BMS3Abin01]|nr:hypothetical protein BMS3Abin01_00452 [bacterium BMS3Abin01]